MKIAIAGDWHANTPVALNTVREVAPYVDAFVHVGDFAYLFDYDEFLNPLNSELEKHNTPLFFIEGNHDDPAKFLHLGRTPDGFRPLTSHISHIPRGHTWEWEDVKFAGIGGAYSIDRKFRVKGESWWPEETISYDEEIDLISRNIQADVLFTHDAPVGVVGFPRLPGFPWLDNLTFWTAYEHQRRLSRIVDSIQPRYLFHGHYHIRYHGGLHYSLPEGVSPFEEFPDTLVFGLAHDEAPLKDNIIVAEVSEGRFDRMPDVWYDKF